MTAKRKPKSRLPVGRPTIDGACTADVIALLAGVNMSAVVKVFAAIEALDTSGAGPVQMEDLRVENAPLEPPRKDGTEMPRVDATLAVVSLVARSTDATHLDYILHMHDRFAASAN